VAAAPCVGLTVVLCIDELARHDSWRSLGTDWLAPHLTCRYSSSPQQVMHNWHR